MHRNCHTRVNDCTFQQVRDSLPEYPAKHGRKPTTRANPGQSGAEGGGSKGCTYIWPIRCEPVCVNHESQEQHLGSTQARKGASEVDSITIGDSCVRTQPRRQGQGVPRVRHCIERQRGGGAGGGAPVLAKG